MSPPLLLTLQFFAVTHAVHWNHIIIQEHHDYQPVSLNVMFISTRLSDVVCCVSPVTSGMVCSDECANETMCWGTGADKCVSCRNFLYSPNNTCVSSCENTGTTQWVTCIHTYMYAHTTHIYRSVLTSQDQFQCCVVLIHYIDTTMVTVLANSADSVIHSVMVHAQERYFPFFFYFCTVL